MEFDYAEARKCRMKFNVFDKPDTIWLVLIVEARRRMKSNVSDKSRAMIYRDRETFCIK